MTIAYYASSAAPSERLDTPAARGLRAALERGQRLRSQREAKTAPPAPKVAPKPVKAKRTPAEAATDRALAVMGSKPFKGRKEQALKLLDNEKLTSGEVIFLLAEMPLDADRSPARKGGNASDVWDAAHARMGLGEKIEASKEKHADLSDRAIAAIGGAQ